MIGYRLISLLVGLSHSNVAEFNQNLPSLIDSGRAVLVSFYAPWCGHCQQLAPTWQKVQERLGDSSIVVGKLDCTAHQDLATRYAIRGFPTIKLFRSGRGIDYEGAREENAIVNWAKKATGPAVLSTKHKIEDMIAKHQVKPVFLFNGNTNSQGFEQFQAAAEKYVPNISFFKNKSSGDEDEKISVIKDGKEYVFKGPAKALKNWVQDERESSFQPLTMKLARQYSSENKFVAVIVAEENEETFQMQTVRMMALDRNNPISNVAFTSAATSMSRRTIDHLTYRECVNGELLILPKGELSGQYYLMALEEESSPDEIGQFIERVKNGEEELQGKSAIGRMISDFVFGFYRIFKENPIMGGLIIGLPTILISFIIWGICSVPEANYEEYDDSASGTDADVSSNEDNDEPSEETLQDKEGLLPPNVRRRQLPNESSDNDSEEE